MGALAKLTLAVAIVGTVGYDAVSITSTHLQVVDQAQEAASLGHDALVNTKSAKAAYRVVLAYAQDHGDTIVPGSFAITSRDHTVTVTFTREARTILSSHLPKVRDYVVANGTGSVGDPVL